MIKRLCFIMLIVIVIFVSVGCESDATEIDVALTGTYYKTDTDDFTYKITNNKMIDTYIIAAALYMDFNSQVLLPNTNDYPVYQKAKEYFTPYKNHEFIKNFHNYVNNQDINGDIVGILLSYDSTPNLNKLSDVDNKYKQYHFKDDNTIDDFISGLKAFYKDTNAEHFFEENSNLTSSAGTYLSKNIDDSSLLILIKEMEDYLQTKDKYYPELPVEYESVITIFRPSMASFYSLSTNDKHRIVTFQSPNDFTRNPYKFDIMYFVENAIHESLHSYINKPIKEIVNKNCIDTSKYKSCITSNYLYKNMPLSRQVDEYLVRAIQGRIYTNVFSETYAYNWLLNKEIHYNGFDDLRNVFEYLYGYEENSHFYSNMDDFLPELVDYITEKDNLQSFYGKWVVEKDITPEGIPSTHLTEDIKSFLHTELLLTDDKFIFNNVLLSNPVYEVRTVSDDDMIYMYKTFYKNLGINATECQVIDISYETLDSSAKVISTFIIKDNDTIIGVDGGIFLEINRIK